MTVSISDMTVPPQKPEMLAEAQATVDKITRNFKRGLITDEERYKEVVDTWKKTDDALTKALLDGLDKYNNIFMMADSGARGSDKQIKQLAGMRAAGTTSHSASISPTLNCQMASQAPFSPTPYWAKAAFRMCSGTYSMRASSPATVGFCLAMIFSCNTSKDMGLFLSFSLFDPAWAGHRTAAALPPHGSHILSW